MLVCGAGASTQKVNNYFRVKDFSADNYLALNHRKCFSHGEGRERNIVCVCEREREIERKRKKEREREREREKENEI